jgi:hypothetical protein
VLVIDAPAVPLPSTPPEPPTPVTWLRIAHEYQSFTLEASTVVRFGDGDKWVQKTLTGYAQCAIATFGSDPLVGSNKFCERQQN